jgi:hypothetical protein
MAALAAACALAPCRTFAAEGSVRRLPVREYRDKMTAGWIGQILGVSWGAPTEGQYRQIMPADKMPPFRDTLINDAFGQDDLYVEMTFLRSMEQYGLDVPIRQAGIDFANSGYPLWVANAAGRKNLRGGIAPPDSSHPKFHNCAGAIDYQIEADYSGLIAPGMPGVVIALGEKFGRLMNYGDGMYAGQFIGALYAEAYFEKDIHKLIQAGLKCIPPQCLYAEMVRDMLAWHRENPNDWEKTWALVDKKYRSKEYYLSALDVKLEGAFVLMGLLYGKGDPDQTIIISCRCGSDSDCNPSSSGGILFTSLGLSRLDERYYRRLDKKAIFSHTAYSFPGLIDVCEKLTRQALVKAGGRVEKDAGGEEVFVIPVVAPKPSKFEDLRRPGPIAGSLFTDAEMAKIDNPGLKWALPKLMPGWELSDCDVDASSMFRQWQGRKNVFALSARQKSDAGWKLARKLEIPAGRRVQLTFSVAAAPKTAGWDVAVKANGKRLMSQRVEPGVTSDGWLDIEAVLSGKSGRTVQIEITGKPRDQSGKRSPAPCYLTGLALED